MLAINPLNLIIIIIGKTAYFEPYEIAFLRRFCHIASDFHLFGIHNNNFFTEQGRQPCVQIPTWRTWSLYLRPLVKEWPSYTPKHWVSFVL
jgi:hypothetical protein